MSTWKPGPDDLVVPVIFVPDGYPEPTEWLAEHSGAFKVRARFAPKDRDGGGTDWDGMGSAWNGVVYDAADQIAKDPPKRTSAWKQREIGQLLACSGVRRTLGTHFYRAGGFYDC